MRTKNTKVEDRPIVANSILAITLLIVISFLILFDLQRYSRQAQSVIEQKTLRAKQLRLQFDANKNGVIDEKELSHSKLNSF